MTVSIVRCNEYNNDLLKEKLLLTFEHLGGIEKFVSKGDKVLLKANLLMKKTPEEVACTNPDFICAIAQILIEYGAEVIIGDSPGGPFLEGRMKSIYKETGMYEAAAISGAGLNMNLGSFEKEAQNSLLLRKIVLTEMINDVDIIINVPKLKTHGYTVYTGAVKNLFGLVPGTVKAEYHVRMPDVNDFTNALIDICETVKPVLHIMDGITGMEGAGPSAGNPRDIGVIIASENPYDLDIAACGIIGLKVDQVPSLLNAQKRQLSSGSINELEIKGEKISDCMRIDFKKAPTDSGNYRKIPKILRRILIKSLRSKPCFDYEMCIGCGDCKSNCPPSAIKMVNRKPVVDYSICINCFCCQELCPEKAVYIKRPFLARLLFR